MTTLYIKTHLNTGLKYFGKTIKKDIQKYKGSGKYWTNHIKTHGYNVKTEILFQSENLEDVKNIALKFSKDNDIVYSTHWANLTEENGLDGGAHRTGHKNSEEHRLAISKSNKGRKHSDEVNKLKARHGEDNGMHGKTHSEETRKKISDNRGDASGVNNGMHGKTHSEETRKKLSDKAKQRPKITCPHCGLTGSISNIKGYHMDNCKLKK
jgi:hypothetical protein